MKLSIKQVVFVLTGLIIISATFFFYKSNYAVAAKKSGKKFGDWTVVCAAQLKDSEESQQCFLMQYFFQKIKDENNKEQNVHYATYQIGYNQDGAIVMIQVLPQGLAIEAGTSIVSSKDLIATGVFTTCDNNKCQARAIISEEDLKKIVANKQAGVAIMDFATGTQQVIPMHTDGLEKGLKYLQKK
ncbi:MAG: invasion associated locus B family protein [Rickettsiaceae bacterium]|nr:invasion associated locus B family protein [Rickettsiaceae bacterium]